MATKKLGEIRDGVYATWSTVACARATNRPVSRVRVFIIGIHTEKVITTRDVSHWQKDLASVFGACPAPETNEFVLPSNHADVRNLKRGVRLAKMKRKRPASARGQARISFQAHANVRRALAQRGIVVPPPQELAQTKYATGMSRLLPTRERDIILMHKFVADVACGLDMSKIMMVWQTHQSIQRTTLP